MKDYIPREAVLDIFRRLEIQVGRGTGRTFTFAKTIEVINAIPAADVRPVVKGRWIRKDSRFCYACSECGEMWAYHDAFKFCPNCGADMRGEKSG